MLTIWNIVCDLEEYSFIKVSLYFLFSSPKSFSVIPSSKFFILIFFAPLTITPYYREYFKL